MNKSQWNELLALRDKADLNAKTNSNLAALESFLATQHQLSLYSKEDKERFRAQFSELSDQEQQALSNRVTETTGPGWFYLSPADVRRLRVARMGLSLHQRAQLLKLVLSAAGTAWLDPGELFEAQLEIDDNSSPERWARPYVHISFSAGNQRRVETVDILESVRSNPTAIGHPAIVFAIQHWQRVVYARRVIERDDVTTRDGWGKAAKEIVGGGREIKTAATNLKALGKLLVAAIQKIAMSKESAIATKMELLALGLADRQTSLHEAWEALSAKESRHLGGEAKKIISAIKSKLSELEKQPHVLGTRRIPAADVLRFLRAKGQGGRRFVGTNEDGNWQRPSWKIFRNAYAGWFFGISQSSVQTYLKRAAKEGVNESNVFQASWVSPKSTLPGVLGSLLAGELVLVREPILLFEADLRTKGIARAIESYLTDE